MKVIKIAGTTASGFLIALLVLIIFVENPEVALYNDTVDLLKYQEKLETENEVLGRFPALKDAKSNLTRIGYLNYTIQNITQGPAPMVTEAESKQLTEYLNEIRLLRGLIRQDLAQFWSIGK